MEISLTVECLGTMIFSCQTCLFFWGNSPALRSFWVGNTIPNTRHDFLHILHVRLCDALRILRCLSKKLICFGVPGRKRFGASLYIDLLKSTSEKGTGCLMRFFLSHLVCVGAVTVFAEVKEKEEGRCISIADWFQVWHSDMVKCCRKFSLHISL